MNQVKDITNNSYWRYFILVARCLLAFIFLSYGWAKLTENQFGLKPEELITPINELSQFRIAWYLFDDKVFKYTIGIFQIIAALMLLYNRTVLLGSFLLLPIVVTILIIDISFMSTGFAIAFIFRLVGYILLIFAMFYHYKEHMKIIWIESFKKVKFKLDFPIWSYFLISVFMAILELAPAIPKSIVIYFLTK